MLDIVAPDEDELSLTVKTEGVNEAKARLAGSSTRNTEPVGEHQPVKDRQDDERGDAARRQESHLNDPVIRERKLIQPLHAQSKTPPAERAIPLTAALARATQTSAIVAAPGPVQTRRRRSRIPRAPNPSRRLCDIHNKMRSR